MLVRPDAVGEFDTSILRSMPNGGAVNQASGASVWAADDGLLDFYGLQASVSAMKVDGEVLVRLRDRPVSPKSCCSCSLKVVMVCLLYR